MDHFQKAKEHPIVIIEMYVVCLVMILVGMEVVGPLLADIHPMFEQPMTAGDDRIGRTRELPETPRGWAIAAYMGLVLVGYIKFRKRVIGPFDQSKWSTSRLGVLAIIVGLIILTMIVFGYYILGF